MAADQQKQRKNPRLTWPEAVSATSGLLILLGVLAVLGYDGIVGGDAPPAIEVRAEAVHETRGGHLVQIVARNEGDETAATVRVVGRLVGPDGTTVETSAATFAYVPAGSERSGGLYFSADPQRYALRLDAEGYVRP
ncbi:hypothetical protein [Salinarimonas ramus]|uniref:TIGR02588 family protein n=1 Tax=Salinarimonas ramus TaxID=690164 RepID=A0A917QKR0_9HYPH|nr:hypothetical protein [Salinarimonas ramus]GGK54567.1 hypothetical protein GCM10011322_46700 [Salinarimonas ramus]